MDAVDIVLKVGSIAGLIGIFYQVQQNKRNRPGFVFTFEGSNADFEERHGLVFCNYVFRGLLRNPSVTPNTIAHLYLLVWDRGKKTGVRRYGHTVKSIANRPTGEILHLPLRFEGRSALRVEIEFEFPVTGTGDEALLRGRKTVTTGTRTYSLPAHNYEFTIEDAAGNQFDHGNSLISREVLDLWWTLPNSDGNPRGKAKHYRKIAWAWFRWKIARLQRWFGFYK